MIGVLECCFRQGAYGKISAFLCLRFGAVSKKAECVGPSASSLFYADRVYFFNFYCLLAATTGRKQSLVFIYDRNVVQKTLW